MKTWQRRDLLKTSLAAGALISLDGLLVLAADLGITTQPQPAGGDHPEWINFQKTLIGAPDDPTAWPAFRQALKEWRDAIRQQLNYDDALYRRPDFQWVPACFSCCFLMVCDERFYDQKNGRFAVDDFLDHGLREFGGHDAVVLWHAYPRIGLDPRNQFDFYRDLPGGLAGLRKVSQRFHEHHTRVFIDYNPWDTGTRREPVSDLDALRDLVQTIAADGIFLDTMDRGAGEFRAKLDAVRPGVALEGEGALPLENLHNHHLSWAQWFRDSRVPGILRNKWVERRHLLHQINRWDRDHTAELHTAWMNGTGMMVWENVFGSWVGWCARDRSLLRAMLPIQRRYAGLFSGEGWTPWIPVAAEGVYAHLWEGRGLRLWTLVNRQSSLDQPGSTFTLTVNPIPGVRYYDLVTGREADTGEQDGQLLLKGTLQPRGIGAFIAGSAPALGADFPAFLQAQAALNARADFGTQFPALSTQLKPSSTITAQKKDQPRPGMAVIGPADFHQVVEMRIRECGFYESQNEVGRRLQLHQPIIFKSDVRLPRYAIDLAPVTNSDYAEFLTASGYQPKHRENFLKHWHAGVPPAGQETHPVVYVGLEDARAFAAWAGKRLPSEAEWQYAAQGPHGLAYPWGNEMKPGCCNQGETGGTTPAKAFPNGRSPFGCYDFCGNVWEWTESERTDGHTRFCMLKGGSYYQAKGSDWYMDGGPQPNRFSAKFLLMWPGLDRCATIGFRCAC